jgi:hypothetical protein
MSVSPRSLTSIQVNRYQKEIIDQAWRAYQRKMKRRADRGEAEYVFVSRGEFLEIMCNLYVLGK